MMNFKTIVTLSISIICTAVSAQDCSRYHPFQEGVELELSHYDKKGRTSSKGIYKVNKVSTIGGAETATMDMELFDEKGKSIIVTSYEVSCKGDFVSIDFSNLFPPAILESYGDMEFEMSGENLQIPNNLSVGQSLPDANALMEIKMNPITMKTNVNITNRKVASKESVTTGAGTFECYLVTYDTTVKSAMGVSQKGSAKHWITEKIGIVKQQNFNGKGKMIGHTELTAYKGINP